MTNPLKNIRNALRLTQADMADALKISRGLWSIHEGKPAGHDVPPHIARSLVRYARSKGYPLSYENIYEGAPLPQMVMVPVADLPPEMRAQLAKRPRRRVIASSPL